MTDNCMICDIYKVIDYELSFSGAERIASDFAANLVHVLPPRGHALHNLAIWHDRYRTPPSVVVLQGTPEP